MIMNNYMKDSQEKLEDVVNIKKKEKIVAKQINTAK